MNASGRRYRVAVLGNCCTHGEFVVAALREEARVDLVAGWEADPRRARALAQTLGTQLVLTPAALIEDPHIDVIAISCDPCDKAHWVEEAAAAGKHIFLNKPFCDSLESARRIESAVEQHSVQLVHDIIAIRFNPVTAKLLDEVADGVYGEPLHHAHSFGMTFSVDFPLAEVWPERLDPPSKSGGGELTNLGCYPIDYMVALWGLPASVQAKSMRTWDVYREAEVENFGQIVADYGSFFAVIGAGKQQVAALRSLDLAGALSPRNWHNVLELQFADANLTVLPYTDLVIRDGQLIPVDEYLGNFRCPTPFEQLARAIETSVQPASSASVGLFGVEVTMGAYRSIVDGGAVVALPLDDGRNPLVKSQERWQI